MIILILIITLPFIQHYFYIDKVLKIKKENEKSEIAIKKYKHNIDSEMKLNPKYFKKS